MQDEDRRGYWLAIDPGGTKCAVLRVRWDGTAEALAETRSPGRSGRDPELVWLAVERALQGCPPLPICIGLSGSTAFSALLCARLAARGHRLSELVVVAESEAALALADETHGIVTLAGTGSFVAAHAPDGRYLRLDGLGPLLGDTGSAFHIGWMAARAAALAAQHPHYATSLLPHVFEALSVSSLGELIGLSLRPLDRSVIASLARVTDDEARRGDATALGILAAASEALAQRTAEIAAIVGLASAEPCSWVGTGSVIQRSDIYWEHLCVAVRRRCPLLRPVRLALPAAVGVALSARRAPQGPHPASHGPFRQRLLDSFRNLPPQHQPQLGDPCHA